jgi:hypothetical protein
MRARLVLALTLAAVVVAGGALVLPGVAPADSGGSKFLALNTRGTAKNISTDPMRTVFEFDVFSLATGERVGHANDSVFCSTKTPPPCQVFDAVTTFHLPDGTLTNHAQVSVVPDPQRPGFFLVASRPEGNSIVGATGVYAGRTGKVRLTGLDDGSRYPAELGVDDTWIFELD